MYSPDMSRRSEEPAHAFDDPPPFEDPNPELGACYQISDYSNYVECLSICEGYLPGHTVGCKTHPDPEWAPEWWCCYAIEKTAEYL